MSQAPLFSGFTWQAPATVLPRVVSAMHYSKPGGRLSRRHRHDFWVLDYARTACGRTRVGSPGTKWQERPAGTAHLYPPGASYWEDLRRVPTVEAAFVVFAGGDEAGLRDCIPPGQSFARVLDTNREVLTLLRTAALAGARRGAEGFWEAQTALAALIELLHRGKAVGAGSADVLLTPVAETGAGTRLVRAVDAFLARRVGGRTTLAEIAAAVRVSPSTLSHRYAAEAGRSPLAAFAAMRLEAARALIIRGTKLHEVAAQTGFCDAFHLSKAFVRQFGMPPSACRRKSPC